MKLKLILFMALFAVACGSNNTQEHSLEYIMDMVHRNPGEPLQYSKYYNEEYVKSLGYNSMVSQIYVQCALTYDDFDKGVIPEGSKEREWIMLQRKEVAEKIKRAKEAGLDIYTFTDVLVLPTMLIEKYQDQLVDQGDIDNQSSSTHGKLAPNIERDLTVTLIKAQIKEIFETFPDLDGIVVRFGETYLYDTPYHSGSSPVRHKEQRGIDGQVKLINILREEICEKYNKKLFYRTWGMGLPFHTDPEVFTAITDRVETHDNLIFSIKYTSGDFHRLYKFNQTIGIGKHPYIIEFQAQPEYYGKGAHPIYLFGSVLNGFSEYERIMEPGQTQSLEQLKNDPKFKGMWSWSRGGGWRGPYIQNELWCDVNAQAMAIWSQNTNQTEDEVLDKVMTNIGVEKSSFEDFKTLLRLTDEAILKGQCTDSGLKFNVWWTRDQYFNNDGTLKHFFSAAIKNGRANEIIAEKDRAVELWEQIVELANKIDMKDPLDEEYVRVSAEYGRIKFDIIRQIFIICIKRQEYDILNKIDIKELSDALDKYDALWVEWQELEDNNPMCANIYEPNGFSLSLENGAAGNPEKGIRVTIDEIRKIIPQATTGVRQPRQLTKEHKK
ncbi:MAG: hypothetical protein SNG27_05285 [Rikenellaceae bacterium]